MRMTIKSIFYDLDGTLRMNEPDGWQVFVENARELGFPLTQEKALEAARWEHYYFAESPELLEDRQKFHGEAFWLNYTHRQLLEIGAAPAAALELSPRLSKKMSENYHPQDVTPADLAGTLKVLRQRGYQLGVLSNRTESFAEYLEQLGLSQYFDLVLFAGEADIYKPDPAVFHYLLKKAGAAAEESMYVGDNYYADVLGSRAAGLTPVLLDKFGIFEEPGCAVITEHEQILGLLPG
ncbi:MAG: HAD family hydrolase [Chloroflexota bacterium]